MWIVLDFHLGSLVGDFFVDGLELVNLAIVVGLWFFGGDDAGLVVGGAAEYVGAGKLYFAEL